MRRATDKRAQRLLAAVAWLGLAAATLALPAAGSAAEQQLSGAGVPALVSELESTDPREREEAAAALSALASAGVREAIRALIPLINDPSSRVRYHAFWGLSRAGEPAVPALVEEFRRRNDDEGRSRVAQVLGRIGFAARAAIPLMREGLRDPQSRTAVQAAYALGVMKAREAIPDLLRAYAGARKKSTHREISRAFRTMGSDQARRLSKPALVASLLGDLTSGDPALRSSAVSYTETLYRLAQEDREYDYPPAEQLRTLVPELILALDAADADTSFAAARALILAGRDASDAVPVLERKLDEKQFYHTAMKALREIGTPEAQQVIERRLAFEALDARVKTDYVANDHQGRVRLLPFRVAGDARDGLRMSARFLYVGRQARRPQHVVIGLESTSEDARFEDVSQLVWISDGARIEMGGLDRIRSQSRSGVIERLSGILPVEDFLALANAQQLSARIGSVEFALGESDRAALRYFASKIPPTP